MNILKILSFILFSTFIFAQEELLTIGANQAPSSANWRHFQSKNFEILFPSQLEKEARRSVHMLEHLSPYVGEAYKVSGKKITIIFQPYSSISNAFVTLAPWRSEWFTMPWGANGMGTSYWTDMLAVHEMRHMKQMESLNQGFNQVLYWILGEVGLGIGIGWSIPPWQMEGDAVVTETKLGPSGRGRVPLFSQHFRSMLLEKRNLNYDQMVLGSYREFIPNHYVYGYHMSQLLDKQDPSVWRKVYWYAAHSSYNPFSFFNAVEMVAGKKVVETLHGEMLAHWSREFVLDQQTDGKISSDWKLDRDRDWTSYERTRFCDNGSVIAIKKSLYRPRSLVLLSEEGETFLTYLGPQSDVPIDCKQGKVVWGEFVPDVRWGKQNYAQIWVMDLETKKISLVSKNTRWFSPSLHPTEPKLIVVETDLENHSKLLEVDYSGNVLKVVKSSTGHLLLTPFWYAEGHEIVYVSQDKKLGKKSVVHLNLGSGAEEVIAGPTFLDLANPVANGKFICFEHPDQVKQNISCYDREQKKLLAVTSDIIGTAFPSFYQDKLGYAQYRWKGYVPRSLSLSDVKLQETVLLSAGSDSDKITSQNEIHLDEDGNYLESKTATSSLDSKEYSLTKHSFNPHSWLLIALPFGPFVALEGRSTDKLSTLEMAAGGAYNKYDGSHRLYARAMYARYFPQFDLQAGRQVRRYNNNEIDQRDLTEDQLEAGISLPFNFSQRGFTNTLKLRAHGQYNAESTDYLNFSKYGSKASLLSNGLTSIWHWQSPQAYRDLFAPWGQTWQLQRLSGAGDQNWSRGGDLRSVAVQHFLPGFRDHHHFVFFTGHEDQTLGSSTYRYISNLPFSRGYAGRSSSRLNVLSANYYFPMAYPDFSFGKWLYLKRIFANVHYDWTKTYVSQYRSYGLETFFETNFFRNMYLSLKWGVRFSYLVDQQKWDVGFSLLNFSGEY